MNYLKTTLGALALVSLTVLASCDSVTAQEGVVLTVKGSTETLEYTAEDLFSQYKGNATGVARFYEAAIELVIRNEMNQEANADTLAEIMTKAENRVDGVKESAQSAADTNRTNYDDELQNKLDSYNVEDLTELKDYFAYQLMKEEVEEQFYEDNKVELLVGAEDYTGYLDTRLPYHVKHILVNVTAGANAYYDGQISADNARKLASVIDRLALQQNGETFGDIARDASDDSVSAANFGDLGIMSLSTSFVNEFKLGVYSYEALFSQNADIVANKEKLNVPTASAEAIGDEIGLTEIPYGAVAALKDYAELTKDELGNLVNDGDTLYYPRNIVFNRYFNRHNVSVVVPEDLDGNPIAEAGQGFIAVPELNNKVVLTDELGRVILVVRGGTSGGSGYQGIHFIVVERSALVDEVNGVSLENYYTTEIPGTADFPKIGNVEMRTFVNFKDATTRIYNERATTISNEVKTFDKMYQARILEKLMAAQSVTFVDENLQEAVLTYIQVTRESNAFNDGLSYRESWDAYTNALEFQERERLRLIPMVCAEDFSEFLASVEYAEGGLCYVQK